MAWRMNGKSMVLGAVLGAGLSVLIGAAANELPGPVGRYRMCCSQNTAYIVDTVTGQVWLDSERGFRSPKLRIESASESPAATVRPPVAGTPAVEAPRIEVPRVEPSGFIGKWVLSHPTQGQLAIQIEPTGQAILTQGDKHIEAKWRREGDQITISTEQESMVAHIDDQGRLMVSENEGEPIAFQRAE